MKGRACLSAPLLLGCMLSMTACGAQPSAPATAPPDQVADCGASQLGAYIGQPASDAMLASIRGWRGDKPVRVLRPGSPMTMDYRPERLNIFLDESGAIKEFRCN